MNELNRNNVFLKKARNTSQDKSIITRFEDNGPLNIFYPALKTTNFSIKSTKFFAIGSCFAKNLANHLRSKGCCVGPYYFNENFIETLGDPLNWACGKSERDNTPWNNVMLGHFDPLHILQDMQQVNAVLNKKSIEYPIWKLSEKDANYFAPGNIHYMSPFHTKIYAKDAETIYSIVSTIYNSMKKSLVESDVFIITYGLAEYLAMNDSHLVAVNYGGTQRQSWRCTPSLMRPIDVKESMLRLINLIKKINPNAILFFSLSPVKLARTYLQKYDIYNMGSLSKAILRCGIHNGIEEANLLFPNSVYYIPSYEYVTLGNYYAHDMRHVSADAVKNIMNCFVESYFD